MAEQSQFSVGGDDTRKQQQSECSVGDNTKPLPPKQKRSCDDDGKGKGKGKEKEKEKEKGVNNDQHPYDSMACLEYPEDPSDYRFSARIDELLLSSDEQELREYIEAVYVLGDVFKRRREDVKARLEKVREQKKAVSEARAAVADLVWDFSSPTLVRNIKKVE